MQKLFGSVIVILAATGIGFEKSNELKIHLQQLEELKKIFTLMRSELIYSKIPFPDLFEKMSEKTEGIFRTWLIQLSQNLKSHQSGMLQDVWRQSIQESFKESYLKREEIEELITLGAELGYIESIELYLEQLEINIQKTREEDASKKKLYQSMGIMGGIFLVILFL